jgi:hypothetical protein
MNHLKRLWEQTNKKPGAARLERRYRKLFLYFLDRARKPLLRANSFRNICHVRTKGHY